MKPKNYFEPVDPKTSFQEMERKLLEDWSKKDIEKNTAKKIKTLRNIFHFLMGLLLLIIQWGFTMLGEGLTKIYGRDIKICKDLSRDSRMVLTARVFG